MSVLTVLSYFQNESMLKKLFKKTLQVYKKFALKSNSKDGLVSG